MSNYPTIPANNPINVPNGFGQHIPPNQTRPAQQRPDTHRQVGPMQAMLRGVSPNATTGRAGGSAVRAFGPFGRGAVPTASSQTTPGKRAASPRFSPPTGKGNLPHNIQALNSSISVNKKKKMLTDNVLPQTVRDIYPVSQVYVDQLEFEKKLDSTIMRKKLYIQEALKRPMKQKRKLRIFISNIFYPAKKSDENEEGRVAAWELKIEGALLGDSKNEPNKINRRFSSFFKSLVIELDKDLYGPDNHLVEWHRNAFILETDGFQVKRPGDTSVRCKIYLVLDCQPLQFKVDPRLALLLGVHTQTRQAIMSAFWQFIKTHKLQDMYDSEYINCGKYLEHIFHCARMKFSEVPQRLSTLLHPPDPIVINHVMSVDNVEQKQTTSYEIDVEVDDISKAQMTKFLHSVGDSQNKIQSLDDKIFKTIESIKQLKTNGEFYLSLAKDPQQFIHKWIVLETKIVKTMTDLDQNSEEQKAEFYDQPWMPEAVNRYIHHRVKQKRAELERQLGIQDLQKDCTIKDNSSV